MSGLKTPQNWMIALTWPPLNWVGLDKPFINGFIILFEAAAAAAKSLQSCPTLCDPIDSSPPGSTSLGFSRQEHWSGLPFPSPMHESEVKVKSLSKFEAAAAKLLQSCLTLCDPIDGSPSGSTVPGILQARILEWVAISFSNAWKWKVKVKSLSCSRLLASPWTGTYQAPPSMGFSRQEYWSGVPLPSP